MTAAFKPLTKDDIAEILGISQRTIENWVNDGTVPVPKRLGNRVYWHPTVFYGWLEQRLTAAEEPETGDAAAVTQPRVGQKPANLTRASKAAKTELGQLKARGQAELDDLNA